jgi:type II secretory pathway pseudopilin PulG
MLEGTVTLTDRNKRSKPCSIQGLRVSSETLLELNSQSSFTLVELLCVVVIILLLAGIIVGTARYVAEKQLRAKAESQLHQISLCLELYKNDQGYYPISPYDWPKSPDGITPTNFGICHAYDVGLEWDMSYMTQDPTVMGGKNFTNDWATYNHWAFFRAILGYGVDGGVCFAAGPPPYAISCATNGFPQPPIGKNYYPEIKPDQLHSNRQWITYSSSTTLAFYWYLVDPFGKPWGYYNASSEAAKTNQFNPRTYDLWSWGPSSFGYPHYSWGPYWYYRWPVKYDVTNSLICNWRR